MDALPTGVVTLLLTEVEDSIRRWEADAPRTTVAVARLDEIVEGVLVAHRGRLVKPRGEGESHFTVFADASDAIEAAAGLIASTESDPCLTAAGVRVRAAVHTGDLELRAGDYYGPDVNRCARLRAIARGGQTLVSGAAAEAAGGRHRVALRDLGRHYLKDLARAEQVFQIVGDGLPDDFGPVVSAPPPGHGLPLPVTSFVGRDADLRALITRCRPGAIVCVTGAPGVGKSRLALETAAALHDEGRAVRFLRADLTDRIDVPDLDSRAVFVVDDADHHLDPTAEVAAGAARGGAAVIITSRTAGPGWEEFALAPLPTGIGNASIRLFADRAEAVRPTFDVGSEAAADLVAVDELLSGLPLAIELAAGRVNVLSLRQIADRLAEPRRILGGAARRDPSHHQSMEKAVAWTADSLPDDERSVLAALATEGTGSAATIAEAAGLGLEHAAQLLKRLVVRSLAEPSGDGYSVLPIHRAFLAGSGPR